MMSSPFHSGVSCEVCHGPAAEHVAAPGNVRPDAPRERGFCPLCHGYDASRPSGFPQIDPVAHNPTVPCMSCHDPDGKSGFDMRPGLRQSLGWLARNEPERSMHKIINGVPGRSMLALRFLEEAVITDLLAYLKTLDPD